MVIKSTIQIWPFKNKTKKVVYATIFQNRYFDNNSYIDSLSKISFEGFPLSIKNSIGPNYQNYLKKNDYIEIPKTY